MNLNLSGITVLDYTPIQTISQEICSVLSQYYNQENVNDVSCIEIEYKYAQFRQFCNSGYVQPICNMAGINDKVKSDFLKLSQHFVLEQSRMHLQTINKLSYKSMILMNTLGHRVYRFHGAFYENVHKKFYKMREFLKNLCQANSKIALKRNFYGEIKNINSNNTFALVNDSQFRLDMNISKGQNSGRYSYLTGHGWVRTRKTHLLRQQLDIMIKQRAFRLAAKREEQIVISADEMKEILHSLGSNIFANIRLKRTFKASRAQIVQYSLSQIYQPQQQVCVEYLQDIKSMLMMDPVNLDEFCQSTFQMFYISSISNQESRKFQIQCQFTRKGVDYLNNLRKQQRYRQIEKQIEKNLGDMYALYFVDHTIKMKQSLLLQQINQNNTQSEISSGKFPTSRLQNEFGSYMHDLIGQYMRQ